VLLDTGSQVSIIDRNVAHQLGCSIGSSATNLQSIGNTNMTGFETSLDVKMPDANKYEIKMQVVNNFKLTMSTGNMKQLINSSKNCVPLSPSVPDYDSDSLVIEALLGINEISRLGVYELKTINDQAFFRLANGYVPIGNSTIRQETDHKKHVNNCKYVNYDKRNIKLKNKYSSLQDECNYNQPTQQMKEFSGDNKNANKRRRKINRTSRINEKEKNVLPKKKYKTRRTNKSEIKKAIVCNIKQSQNEENTYATTPETLERLWALEGVGIKTNDISLQDQEQIEIFKKQLTLCKETGKYLVTIPWKHDILKKVPSNFLVAKILARKIHERNAKNCLDVKYNEIFRDQLESGIIEEININDEFNPEDHVWIPHSPVIKTCDNETTKLRIVYNCSFKYKNNPSLNDASFDCIDLSNDLLGLINYARTNDNILLADIEKAFLQIRLKNDYDKNKFSFLVFRNGRYYAYRFNTILFGHKASPFVLYYVLQHHAKNVSDPKIRDAIQSKFYVDNLLYTFNDGSSGSNFAQDITMELAKVGFSLREFVSNDNTALNNLQHDKISATTTDAKLLGYLYNSHNDTLYLKPVKLDRNANTRRKILSALASIYDPLGLSNPLAINGKLILRAIVEQKLSWDCEVPSEIMIQYSKLCDMYDALSESFTVPRKVLNENDPCDLICIVDASKEAYCVVIYTIQNNQSNLLFSKVKLAPKPTRTLPSLELLASYLAIQCVNTIVSDQNFQNIKVNNVSIYSDSQVALSWLLKGSATRKNIFINTRLTDIKKYSEMLTQRHIDVKYKYVTVGENIADRITRRTNISQIYEKIDT